jgi:hypothetical protein
MNIPDHIFESLEKLSFWIKNTLIFDADPGSGMEQIRIRDPAWKKVGSGIRDKHPGSVTLMKMVLTFTTFLFYIN